MNILIEDPTGAGSEVERGYVNENLSETSSTLRRLFDPGLGVKIEDSSSRQGVYGSLPISRT